MASPEKPIIDREAWLNAILPNPFIFFDCDDDDALPALPSNRILSPKNSAATSATPTESICNSEDNADGPRFEDRNRSSEVAVRAPREFQVRSCDDGANNPPQADSSVSKPGFDGDAVALPKPVYQLRGITLLGVIFDELSNQLGAEFSTTELMQAAQRLIDISKTEYVGRPFKDIAERAGYYSWDLVRAFASDHPWQIAGFETSRMDHCDVNEFAPESYETAKLLLQGWNERTWEF